MRDSPDDPSWHSEAFIELAVQAAKSVAIRFRLSSTDEEDLFQCGYVKLLTRPQPQSVRHLYAWLKIFYLRVQLDRLRQGKSKPLEFNSELMEQAADSYEAESEIIAGDQLRHVEAALADESPENRSLFWHITEGGTYREWLDARKDTTTLTNTLEVRYRRMRLKVIAYLRRLDPPDPDGDGH